MRSFQRKAIDSIQAVLSDAGLTVDWTEETRSAKSGFDYVDGDVDLKTRFSIGQSTIEVWVYVDELGHFVNSDWSILESQDYPDNEDKMIADYCDHLNRALRAAQ